MKTEVLIVDPLQPDQHVLQKAADILKKGGLAAFPTETVYGLGGNALCADAALKIYEAKGRPSDNPLIVHIADKNTVYELVREINPIQRKLMQTFWPGPLTLVFPKKDCVPKEITGGLDSVAVRFPDHAVAKALIGLCGFPLAAPSANLSGRPSPTQVQHVVDDLDGKIDVIIDGGPCAEGLESTIVDVTGEQPCLLRPGTITVEMLEKAVGSVDLDPSLIKKPDATDIPKAPGMKYTHYAPQAEVWIVKGLQENMQSAISQLLDKDQEEGLLSGVMKLNASSYVYPAAHIFDISVQSMETTARMIFDCLRACDRLGLDKLYVESIEESGLGFSIMNRLKKAAGYRIIETG